MLHLLWACETNEEELKLFCINSGFVNTNYMEKICLGIKSLLDSLTNIFK